MVFADRCRRMRSRGAKVKPTERSPQRSRARPERAETVTFTNSGAAAPFSAAGCDRGTRVAHRGRPGRQTLRIVHDDERPGRADNCGEHYCPASIPFVSA
jgi:hypothetical protein